MKDDGVARLIGLAQKSGNVASGEFMTEKSVKRGKAYLVLLAQDASDNTRKKFQDMCNYYEVPFRIYVVKEDLGHAIGKQLRASLAVTDEGLAKAIMKKMD